MRIALVFPPQGHFTQPYLALPALQAYLKQEGFADTHVIDANIEAYEYFLSRERLGVALEKVRAKGCLADLEQRATLGYADMSAYRGFSQAELSGEWVVEGIEEAKAVLRDPERFYDRDAYTRSARCIEQALALISAEFAPSYFAPHGFSMRHSVQSTDQILAGAVDEEGNPFLEFFRQVTLPQLQELDPDLVGISVTFTSQAIPAVALAILLKAWKPSLHITFGGGLMAYVGKKLALRPELFDVIDSIVLLEGELPLTRIARALDERRGLADIPNIIYRQPAGEVVIAPEAEPLAIDSLPPPDFSGLPLDLYFSPEFIIPLAITRGCYWGKCVFCTLHKVIGPGYRGRSIEKVVEDIRYLKDKWGSRRFYFPIEDLPPNMVKRLPEAILEAGLDIDWWCDAKIEPEVFTDEVCANLAQAGCKRLAFGFESASERVLELMCKGSAPEPGMEVIRRVHAAGISVTLYVMVGFPTETEDEARETLSMLLANRDSFEEVSLRVFYLDDMSEVYKRPEEFAIAGIVDEPGMDLQVYRDFSTATGMTRARARRVYLTMLERLKSNLPVFQNDNLLYHELKSHYFLYLVRAGGVEQLMKGAFAPVLVELDGGLAAGELDHAWRPRRNPCLSSLPLAFDRDEVDRALERATDGLTLPRYQFDLIGGAVLEQLNSSVSPLAAKASVLLHNGDTGEISCLSPDAAALLESCTGAATLADILGGYDAGAEHEMRAFLDELIRAGLLQSPAGIPSTQVQGATP